MGMMSETSLANASLDLSLMFREPVFVSRSAQETQSRLALELADHELNWQAGLVDTEFYHGPVGRMELYALRYGAEVEIRPQPFDDFVLVQMPLRGSATFQAGGKQHRVGTGEVVILAPEENTSMVWHQGCEQLILRMPNALVSETVAHMADEGNLPREFRLPAVSTLQRPVANRWFGLVAELLQFLPGGTGSVMHSRWLKHLEECLPLFLLSHLTHSDTLVERSVAPRGGARQLHKIDAFMRDHVSQSITLTALAAAGGVSVRSLNTLCRREYGQSPMERLRALRLDAARECLLLNPHLSITQVALDHGFSHMGRFASYYQHRFGELPKATLLV